jgi:hypothetical protein
MAKPCTAILINATERTVTEVQWNGDYKQIYELIGVDCFDVARINNKGDGIFVDDEGLYKDEQVFFQYEDYPSPLAGNGLVLGCDYQGESVKPHVTLEEVRAKTRFVEPVRLNIGGKEGVVLVDLGHAA